MAARSPPASLPAKIFDAVSLSEKIDSARWCSTATRRAPALG
jgi:hypothetical protein